MTRILVVEDEDHIRNGLVDTFESEGYQVDATSDGEQALAKTKKCSYDLVVLDVMMPQMSGYDVCRELRRYDVYTPVLMLTAKGEEIDKVVGLQLGADDYVTKPFGIHELLARVSALLRRSRLTHREEVQDETFVFGHLKIDPTRQRAYDGDCGIDLSARELLLLRSFAKHPDQVLDRNHLLDVGWGQEYMGTSRTLDQHIAQLRKKIEVDPAKPGLITTVHGVGYRYAGKVTISREKKVE